MSHRKLPQLAGVALPLVALLALPEFVFGQETSAWPQFPTVVSSDPHDFVRGPGYYFAMYKLILLALPIPFWVKLSDWLNRDAQLVEEKSKMPADVWNSFMVFPFWATFLLAISFPIFWVFYPLTWVAIFAPLITYVVQRNAKLPKDQSVFTAAHWKRIKAGKTQDAIIAPLPQDSGSPVEFEPAGGDKQKQQMNHIAARRAPQYVIAKDMMADAVGRRVDQIMFDFTKDAVGIRYQVDGLWHPMPQMDRPTGDGVLEVFKYLANLNPHERRAKQEGLFHCTIPGRKIKTFVTSQGVPTGERALLRMVLERKMQMNLAEAGMLPTMETKLKSYLNSSGIVVAAAMPGDGMTTLWNAVLASADRITRDFIGFAEKGHDETKVENIEFARFNANDPNDCMKQLKTLLLKQPEAIVLPDPSIPAVLDALADLVVEDSRFIATRIGAKSAAEAIVRMIGLKNDRSKFAKAVTAVVYQRLIRRLCDYCKQPFQPNPQLLKRLGLPANAVPALFKQYEPPPPEALIDEKGRPIEPPPPCRACGGLGYIGRIGVFELLEVNDEIRRALVNEPKVETIAAIAKKSGNATLQDEGVKLVLAGVTSLEELQRILKL